MNNQSQNLPYEMVDVINNILQTNADLVFENAELKATIKKMNETSSINQLENESEKEGNIAE